MKLKRRILVISCILLALASCGKKGNPIPKGLPEPTAIGDLKGEAKDAVLFLSFSVPTTNRDGTEVRDLEGFKILKSCGGCGGGFEPWKEIRLTDRQGYTIRNGRLYTYDDDLRVGFDYAYRVFPFSTKGVQGEGSNVFSIKWQKTPPAPKNVTVQEEDARIVISWQRENGTLYNVYRREDKLYALFPANSSPLAASEFSDRNLRNGTQYQYEVRAVRMEGKLPFEGEGTAVSGTPRDKTPPSPPRELKLELRNGGVFLSWAANDEADLGGYNVYRIVSGQPVMVNKDRVPEPRYLDQKLGTERYVSYYVTAVDRAGNESGPSREQIIIVKE